MLPIINFRLEMPEPLSQDASFLRIHRRAVRESLTRELENHHRRRFPQHFEASARGRYQHKERSGRYKAVKLKRFRSRTDHVKTGRTRDKFRTQRQIRIRGTATGQFGAIGQLILRFPFPASFDNSPNKVDLRQMADELARFTPDEEKEVAASFAADYTKRINDALAAAPRIRKRITGA